MSNAKPTVEPSINLDNVLKRIKSCNVEINVIMQTDTPQLTMRQRRRLNELSEQARRLEARAKDLSTIG